MLGNDVHTEMEERQISIGSSPSDTDQTRSTEKCCSRRDLCRDASAEAHLELRQKRFDGDKTIGNLEKVFMLPEATQMHT